MCLEILFIRQKYFRCKTYFEVLLIRGFASILKAVKDSLTRCTKKLQQHTEDIELTLLRLYTVGRYAGSRAASQAIQQRGWQVLITVKKEEGTNMCKRHVAKGQLGMPGNPEPQGMRKAGGINQHEKGK